MKVKNVNLEWYALRWDFNNNKLGMHDVYKPGWTFKKK